MQYHHEPDFHLLKGTNAALPGGGRLRFGPVTIRESIIHSSLPDKDTIIMKVHLAVRLPRYPETIPLNQ
jgi:hypothetical protein